jgi:hypothetical protein
MVIVTGADSAFGVPLANLVGSIHFWMPETKIAIFNLGLEPDELQIVGSWRNCRMHWSPSGPPSRLRVARRWKSCPHLRNLKWYAWKPPAIVEALQTYGTVLWIDAGCDLRSPLGRIEKVLDRDGYFFAKGQDLDMTAKLHKGCLRELGLRKTDFVGKPSFSGGLQGYVRGRAAGRNILMPMYVAACRRNCIAPPGSSLRNHRYDQSILSLLAYTCSRVVKDHTEFLCSNRSELKPNPAEPSGKLIYTAHGSSMDYVRYLKTQTSSF